MPCQSSSTLTVKSKVLIYIKEHVFIHAYCAALPADVPCPYSFLTFLNTHSLLPNTVQ